jgi:hypothetical protein
MGSRKRRPLTPCANVGFALMSFTLCMTEVSGSRRSANGPHIAARTVEALAVTLTPEERHSLSEWGTHNAAAYDEYLQGEGLYERVEDRARFDASRPYFERALAIDPQFAPAMRFEPLLEKYGVQVK